MRRIVEVSNYPDGQRDGFGPSWENETLDELKLILDLAE